MHNQIQRLNAILNQYHYGLVINNIPITDNIDYLQYHSLSKEDFKKYKTGICWDYVNYEAWYFQCILNMSLTTCSLQNNNFSLYYMQHEIIDNNKEQFFPSHTWLAYKIDDMIYSFESSWKKYQGVNVFNTELEMCEYYNNIQSKWYDDYRIKSYIILKYLPQPSNLTITSFVNNVLKTGIIYDYKKK